MALVTSLTTLPAANTAVLVHTAVGHTRLTISGGGASLWLGDSTVDSSTGISLSGILQLELSDGQELYAVSNPGGGEVRILSTN